MKQWQNILIKVLWSIAGAALIFLFIIAWKAKLAKQLAQIQVELVGKTSKALFMDENEITQTLKEQGITKGAIIENINLTAIEKSLEKIKWIKNAELFINNQQLLEVKIEQRIPIARVFTVAGSSFYIDNEGRRLPLKQLMVLRLPVFTGFATGQEKLSIPDSLMLMDILHFSNTIKSDSFFTAQIAQINIESNGDFQLVPSLGDHIVWMGSVDHLEDKLNRLYTFYKKVWVQSGINAYQVLDCRFDQQIVALKKGMQPVQYSAGRMPFKNAILPIMDSVVSVIQTDPEKKTYPVIAKLDTANNLKNGRASDQKTVKPNTNLKGKVISLQTREQISQQKAKTKTETKQ